MRVFVTGATGALGRHLVPGLVAAGHEVTATTRTPGKAGQLRAAGAEPVVVGGLDRAAVIAAVLAAAPEVIVHQMTALAGLRSLRNPDKAFAVTSELRTRGTDNVLAAAARAGTRRVIAQGYAGQLTVALALSLPDLQDHLHRALAQLIGVLPLCRHDSASSQGSEPPRSPGRSIGRRVANALRD